MLYPMQASRSILYVNIDLCIDDNPVLARGIFFHNAQYRICGGCSIVLVTFLYEEHPIPFGV